MTEKFSSVKKEFAYLENKPELFETKVLRLNPAGAADRTLLVASRDPGSGNAIIPVLKKLEHDQGLGIIVITDGFAQEKFQNEFATEDVSPNDMLLAADGIVQPNAVLIDRSENMGIEMYTVATFPEVPTILIEDYYTNSIHFLAELKNRNLSFPEKICVADEQAKQAILVTLPELAEDIEVTGQPALDRFAEEDTENIGAEIKSKLGLSSEDKLVSFMSTFDGIEKIQQLASSLKNFAEECYFAFRRHPRDSVSYDEYRKLFTDVGLKIVDTDMYTTDEINIASDVIITTWSTEGLNGIYRRKPTVHIIDLNFPIPEGLALPLPVVANGASIGLDKVKDIETVLPALLDLTNETRRQLLQNIDKHYQLDGKNAERVTNIVRSYCS